MLEKKVNYAEKLIFRTKNSFSFYDNETHVYTLRTFVYIKKSNIENIEVQGLN